MATAIGAELSERELEVWNGMARGLFSKEIADHLKLSIKTVEKHRQMIYYKFEICNPIDAIRVGLQQGCMTIDDFLNIPIRKTTHKKPRDCNSPQKK